MKKSNLAYKTNLSHIQKERYLDLPKKSSHIGRVKKAQIKTIKPTFYIFLIGCAATILSFYIANIVKGSVLTFKITAAKKQLNIQNSESIRLHSDLSKFLNSAEIEKYAKLNLNMKKQSSNQVHYITHQRKNKGEMLKNKSENLKKNENFLEKTKNSLKSIIK